MGGQCCRGNPPRSFRSFALQCCCLALQCSCRALLLPGPAMLLPGHYNAMQCNDLLLHWRDLPATLQRLKMPSNAAAWPCNAAACDAAAGPCITPTTLLPDPAAPFHVTIKVLDHVTRSCSSLLLLDHVTRSVQYQSIPRGNQYHSTTESTFNPCRFNRQVHASIYIYWAQGPPES